MTSRERVRAAMRHEVCDRVPVMCQIALGHYFINSGRKPSEIWFDSETFAAVLIDFQRRYGFDGVLINLPGRPANWRDDLVSLRTTGENEELVWSSGLVTRVPADDNPHTFVPPAEPLPRAIPESVDLDDPATFRFPGYLWNTWHAPSLWDIPGSADLGMAAAYPEWFTLAVRAARRLGPDVSVHSEVFSPFTHLLELFGYEQALMALMDVPEVCHRLLEIFSRHVAAQITCLAASDPDAILVSSAFAGAGFISPIMYREFVAPYEKRIAAVVHRLGLPVYVHTCGAIGDRLDLMAETDVDGIDTLDPPPLGTVDLARAKAEFGKRFFFKGNLDAVNEMLRADDAVFERAVRRRLEIGKVGSGYILSSACSVAPHVEPERLRRMVELADRYGRP